MKSAPRRKGSERPRPEDHEETIRCIDMLTPPTRITIVDDVVTRGATLLACARVVARRYPDREVRTLAIVRTMSKHSMLDPVEGRIHVKNGVPRREP